MQWNHILTRELGWYYMQPNADTTITCWCGNRDLLPYNHDYRCCMACGGTLVSQLAVKSEDLLADAADDGFYGREYWRDHMQALGLPDIETRAQSDLPERNIFWLSTLLKYKLPQRGKSKAKLVEVGCAHGGFVALAHWAGFDARGCELSHWMREFATTTFGINVLEGRIEDQESIKENSLDAIMLMDVMEHLPFPLETMRHCLKLLKDDGILLIQAPNFIPDEGHDDLLARDDAFLRMLIANEHLFLYSYASAKAFYQRLGAEYQVIEQAFFPEHDHCLVVSKSPIQPLTEKDLESYFDASAERRIIRAFTQASRLSYQQKLDIAFLNKEAKKREDALLALLADIRVLRRISLSYWLLKITRKLVALLKAGK